MSSLSFRPCPGSPAVHSALQSPKYTGADLLGSTQISPDLLTNTTPNVPELTVQTTDHVLCPAVQPLLRHWAFYTIQVHPFIFHQFLSNFHIRLCHLAPGKYKLPQDVPSTCPRSHCPTLVPQIFCGCSAIGTPLQ